MIELIETNEGEILGANDAIEIIKEQLNIKTLHAQTFARYREKGLIKRHNKGEYLRSEVLASIKYIAEYRSTGKLRGAKKDFNIKLDSGFNLFIVLMNKHLTGQL